MPSIANVTVKKNDGVTDLVYTSKSPAAGDTVPAIWRADSIGTAPSHQPEFRLTAREAQKGAARALRSTFVYPQIATNSTTTVTSVVNKAMASTDWTIPKGMSAADINEFATQYGNLLASTLIKSCVKDGYSAS
jgi:hypothetical protein